MPTLYEVKTLHVQFRSNAWYLRRTIWDKELKKRRTESTYLGTNPREARALAAQFTDDPTLLDKIYIVPPTTYEDDLDTAMKGIATLLNDDKYLPVIKNGAIRSILSNTLRQLAQLNEFGDEDLPETPRCQSCQLRHKKMCLKFNKTFSSKDDAALCPLSKPGSPAIAQEREKGISLF